MLKSRLCRLSHPRKSAVTFCTIWADFRRKLGMVTLSRVGIKVWRFTYFTNTILGQLNVKKRKNSALSCFAAMCGKWHFRKVLTQFFELDFCFSYHALISEGKKLDFMAPEYNAESIGPNLKCQKSKTKKLIYFFCTGKYIAISRLTRQWRH